MNIMRFPITILLFFMMFTSILSSQNSKTDSLKIVLENHKTNDTTKAILLYELAFSNFQKDLGLTKSYLVKAEHLSNTLNYTRGKAKVLYLKGILESRKSNHTKSLNFFKNSLAHYKSIQDQRGIANIYTAFGITNYNLSQYDEALNNYKKAAKIYKILDNKKELVTCLINSGNVYTELGRYNDAISNYKKALTQSKIINDEDGIYFVNANLGSIYSRQGNFPLAIESFNKSLEYRKKTNDTLSAALLLNNLGEIYKSLKKYNKALEYHKESLAFALQKENKSLVASNSNNIGNIYMHKKEYQKALKHYLIVLEINQEINDLKQVSICFINIGEVNLLLNRPLIARKSFIKARDISQRINIQRSLSVSLIGISKTYLQEEQYQKARSYVNEGKYIAEKLELLEIQKKAAELLYIIYKNTKEYEKALDSHEKLKLLSDSLFNKEKIEKITALEYEYKYKQVLDSASIRELKLTKTVLTTSQNLKKSQQHYLFAIIGVLLISIVLGAVIFYQKLRNIKSKTKNIIIEQKLLRTQMTPHFIFNALSVLQGMILNNENKKSVLYLTKFSRLLRIILENSRDKIVPLEQELIGVKKYLELQNLEANLAYQYNIIVDNTVDTSQFQIPPMLIQPFIENSIEHGFEDKKGNRKIDIRIKYIDKTLICTIADNGVGINTKKTAKNNTKKSLATTITTERLNILSKHFKSNGGIKIEDRAAYNEQGTIVTLTIPYTKDIL
ncbi:tetratricopeptide repeat protein [Aquimarina sp. I32.4]|uniref:tetratricopeptide repeat-containing sensor histidine kinase n=1 Tax=Aquimarina sp. I32.4 TaxID=2053903 RepID=UPI000CDED8E4|nr:tetratricopeptide repeat protein [Aquimarina sp. I32.4]